MTPAAKKALPKPAKAPMTFGGATPAVANWHNGTDERPAPEGPPAAVQPAQAEPEQADGPDAPPRRQTRRAPARRRPGPARRRRRAELGERSPVLLGPTGPERVATVAFQVKMPVQIHAEFKSVTHDLSTDMSRVVIELTKMFLEDPDLWAALVEAAVEEGVSLGELVAEPLRAVLEAPAAEG